MDEVKMLAYDLYKEWKRQNFPTDPIISISSFENNQWFYCWFYDAFNILRKQKIQKILDRIHV